MIDNQGSALLLIKQLTGQANILTIPRVFIDFMGSLEAALLLSQMLYWSNKTKRRDGYFYKSYPEWERETTLTQYQVSKAIKKLASRGLVTTKIQMANGMRTLHYKLHVDRVMDSLLQYLTDRNPRKLQKSAVVKNSMTGHQKTSSPVIKKLDDPEHRLQHKLQQGEGGTPTAEFFMVEEPKPLKVETPLATEAHAASSGTETEKNQTTEKQVSSGAPTSETYSLKDAEIWRLWKKELPPLSDDIPPRLRAAWLYLLLCPKQKLGQITHAKLDEVASLGIVDAVALRLWQATLEAFVAAKANYSNVGYVWDCFDDPGKLDKLRLTMPPAPQRGLHQRFGL